MADYPSDYDMFDPDADNILSVEVIEHPPASTDRSHARLASLQALYEIDVTTHPLGEVISRTIEANPEAKSLKPFILHLVTGTHRYTAKIDDVLRGYAPEFPLEQVAVIDRNILRMALYEAVFEEQRNINIIVGEAVWLALIFGSDGSVAFINGVLGNVAHSIEGIRKTIKADDVQD